MATQFGFLSQLEFLQDWLLSQIFGINPIVVHNLDNYHTLRKAHYLSAIDNVSGDYLEFGVFTGSSFFHSMRCFTKLVKRNLKIQDTRLKVGHVFIYGIGDVVYAKSEVAE
jgi:O-methyltransferase